MSFGVENFNFYEKRGFVVTAHNFVKKIWGLCVRVMLKIGVSTALHYVSLLEWSLPLGQKGQTDEFQRVSLLSTNFLTMSHSKISIIPMAFTVRFLSTVSHKLHAEVLPIKMVGICVHLFHQLHQHLDENLMRKGNW